MKTILQSTILILTVTFFSGCAFVAQDAYLDPEISVIQSTEGQGITVSVVVQDERPNKSLGHRGAGMGKGAEITTDENVAALVQAKIIEGLHLKGFSTTTDHKKGNAHLNLELRLLEYSTSTGFWTGGVEVNGAIKAYAENSLGKEYKEFYRFEEEERVVFVPGAGSNEEMINKALSKLIMKVLNDRSLIDFLIEQSSDA